MGQIVKTNFKIINSNRPTRLIGTTEPGVLLDIDNVESGGKVVPPYNPAQNYAMVIKRCNELSPALTAATSGSSSVATGNFVCAYISASQGGTGAGCYDNGLFNLPCVPYYAGGNCFPDQTMCLSVCPQSVANPGGNNTLNGNEVAKRLRANVDNKLLDENPKERFGQDESAFVGAFAGAPPPGPHSCQIYDGDIWIDRFWDEQTNTFVDVQDCYPNVPGRLNMGCPAQPGQCFFWNAPATPVCVVERLLDRPAGYNGARDGFICETCLQPTCASGPGCSPNGSAAWGGSIGGTSTPTFPLPFQVLINPTGAFCTDCNPVSTTHWYFCLHNTDPIWTPTNSCIQLSANTIVNILTNPFPAPSGTLEYYATNGPNTYRLSSNTYQLSSTSCELTCVGGCKTEVSGGTVACNYNVNAAYDDGSCCFSQPCVGCGDPTAINYEPTSCSFNNIGCLYLGEGCVDNSVGTSTDINGNTTCGPNANQLCQYCNYDPAATIPKPCCDTVGCMNNLPGTNPDVNGLYTCGPLANQGCLAFNYDPDACCPGFCCNQMGCTDSAASNYDPTACIDDGSCQYIFPGCTNNTACNYDPTATTPCTSGGILNGCCEYPLCLDQYATNYNPSGTLDCDCIDQSVIPAPPLDTSCCNYIFGCLDPNAYNYSSGVAGCDNGNGVADPTNFSCCLYPTWSCNPNLDIEGPGGSGNDIWEYCVLQDNQNGYATKEECWCQCGEDCNHPVNCNCCDKKVDPSQSFPQSLTASTAPCCIEYLLWDINLQAFRMKGVNDYCITGDMRYLFAKKQGVTGIGQNIANVGCQGYSSIPVPFDVGWINNRGIKYGEEVILKPTAMFGNTDPVGAYFFQVTCQNTDYAISEPSISQICIDYIPGTSTLKQSFSINNNGLPGIGFGFPNTTCSCNIQPCDTNGSPCSSPDCYKPGSMPNYPAVTELLCCIKNFGIALLIPPSTSNPQGGMNIYNTLGYVGDRLGVTICQEYVNAYSEVWRKENNSVNWLLVMTGGPSFNMPGYSFQIVTPGNYVEYKVFLDCGGANCYQNRAGTAPNPTPPVGACDERKICLKRVGNTNDWQLVPCKGGPIIIGPIDDVLTSDG